MTKRASKWYHIDAVLGKPHASHKAKLLVLSASELGRWVAKHLGEGYTITLTEVEKHHGQAIGYSNLKGVRDTITHITSTSTG